jgi:plasmid stability protein
MSVTLTIKQVSDRLAEKLRLRAAANHRSLQGELTAILEEAVLQNAPRAEQRGPSYTVKSRPAASSKKTAPVHGQRMTLAELWERSRRLEQGSKSESAAIVRTLRDERHGR